MESARGARGRRPVALVTGASSGIGEALARRVAQRGYHVVLVARSAAKLEALAAALRRESGVHAWSVPADLARPDAVGGLAAALRRARRPVDLLVNNAGIMVAGDFVATPAHRHDEMIALNVRALTLLVAHFVPPMVARGHGRVLNVASIAAFQPVPTLATYAATKAFVLSLTEALIEELRGSGVTATALCPGITDTAMFKTAQRQHRTMSRLPRFLVSDADAVAAEGIDACLAGEAIRIPGAINQAAMLAGRATPRGMLRRVSGVVSRRIR